MDLIALENTIQAELDRLELDDSLGEVLVSVEESIIMVDMLERISSK